MNENSKHNHKIFHWFTDLQYSNYLRWLVVTGVFVKVKPLTASYIILIVPDTSLFNSVVWIVAKLSQSLSRNWQNFLDVTEISSAPRFLTMMTMTITMFQNRIAFPVQCFFRSTLHRALARFPTQVSTFRVHFECIRFAMCKPGTLYSCATFSSHLIFSRFVRRRELMHQTFQRSQTRNEDVCEEYDSFL